MIVYILTSSIDPDNIRYVGITSKTLDNRLYFHVIDSKRKNNHKNHWIQKEINSGNKILIKPLLENLTEEEAKEREVYFIKKFRDEGFKLTNSTDGGDGVINPCIESRMKISAKNKGKTPRKGAILSEETKEKIRRAHLGKKHSHESIEKIRKAGYNRIHSEETKLKMSKIQSVIQKGKGFPEHALKKAIEVNKKAVLQFDKNGNFIKEWDYAGTPAKLLGIHKTTIQSVCSGKSKTAAGYIWKYKNL